MTTTRLREGHAELHDRLTKAVQRQRPYSRGTWAELAALLAEARDALLKCPHIGCAYYYQVEKETR